jgi:hypothetical protein
VRRQRFFSEARAAAALAHPHICTVYDVAESEDGRPYIAIEWLEGPTLRERLTGTPLPLDELLEVGLRVAEALEAAHVRVLPRPVACPAPVGTHHVGRSPTPGSGLRPRLAGVDSVREMATIGMPWSGGTASPCRP